MRHLDPAGHHEPEDFEDIPPEPATMSSIIGNKVVEDVAEVYASLGLKHTLEPGWQTRNPGYNWYPNAPRGLQLHHTGTATYEPRRAYPLPQGTRNDGTTICQMLVQPDGTVNFISTDPANYSSGLNEKKLLTDYVERERRFHGPQSGAMSKPDWFGNREWVNIEVVNPGNGAVMSAAQEESVITLCAITLSVLHTDSTGLIAHADGRGTKQDPRWDGPVSTPPYSIAGIQDAVQKLLDDNELPEGDDDDMPTLFQIGYEYPRYEEVSWLLFQAAGGTINVNQTAGDQIGHDPKLVTRGDFDSIADLTGMSSIKRAQLIDDGLYSAGKEIAALRKLTYEG